MQWVIGRCFHARGRSPLVRAAAGCLSAIEMQLLYELIPRGSNSCAGFFEKHCAKKSPLASSGGGTASAVTEGFNPRRHGRIVRAAKGCLSAFLHGGLLEVTTPRTQRVFVRVYVQQVNLTASSRNKCGA